MKPGDVIWHYSRIHWPVRASVVEIDGEFIRIQLIDFAGHEKISSKDNCYNISSEVKRLIRDIQFTIRMLENDIETLKDKYGETNDN